MKLLSFVHILFVVSPYPVDLVGHIGRNKAMQQYLVVESLCVPQWKEVSARLHPAGAYRRAIWWTSTDVRRATDTDTWRSFGPDIYVVHFVALPLGR